MQTYNPNKAIRVHIILLALIIAVTVFCSRLCIKSGDYWSLIIFGVILIANFFFNIKGIRLGLRIKKFSAKQAELCTVEALILKDKEEGNAEAMREHISQAQKLAKELQTMVITAAQKKK
jgi:hypothetical protein